MEFLKKQAVNHYKRMIGFAELQPIFHIPSLNLMENSICESWSKFNCVYCYEYSCNCIECELSSVTYKDGTCDNCCVGLYVKMRDAETWKEWIPWAKKVLEYIKENG